jgi:hypothetical protein
MINQRLGLFRISVCLKNGRPILHLFSFARRFEPLGKKHADLIGREGTGEQVGGTGTQARCST